MRSEGLFTYPRSAYTNFLHEERKIVGCFSPAGRTVRTLRVVWRKFNFIAHTIILIILSFLLSQRESLVTVKFFDLEKISMIFLYFLAP